MTRGPGPDLLKLLGEPAFVALAEAFGGTRLYVPAKLTADHDIVRAVGAEAAERLSQRLAPDYVTVPLAREIRARHYRALGQSKAQVARRLGMTENGVQKLLKRAGSPADSRPDPLPLFPD